MVSSARAEQYSADQARIVALVRRDLARWWASVDVTDALAAQAAAQEFMQALLVTYGPISAAVAADYYDEAREAAGARGRFAATLADALDVDQLNASTRWAIGPLFAAEQDREAALGRLSSVAQRLTQEYGRQTLTSSAERDPAKPRFARVPHGKTCAFCRMVASRGAEYLTAKSAGEMKKFHDDCDCQIVASFSDDDLPYDPEVYLDQYLDAREAADSGSTKKILGSLREQQGIH